jgi:cardiolipin synthase
VEAIFLSDWRFTTGQSREPTERVQPPCDTPFTKPATLQVIPVGPDAPAELLQDLWITAINRATKRVWIVTPYFVPPPMALRSLAMAARRGLDIRILIPNQSDVWPPDFVRYRYAADLHDLGAKILRFPEKMVHAKIMLVDDEVAFLGSANCDNRSLFLNYELVIAIFDAWHISEVSTWFQELEARSEKGPAEETWKLRVIGLLTRVFADEL